MATILRLTSYMKLGLLVKDATFGGGGGGGVVNFTRFALQYRFNLLGFLVDDGP